MCTLVCVTLPTGSMWWRRDGDDEATTVRENVSPSSRCNYSYIITDGHCLQRDVSTTKNCLKRDLDLMLENLHLVAELLTIRICYRHNV